MKRSFVLLCLLFSVACKNTNSTMGPKKMPFEHAAYLYLPHAEDQSVLRRKLLNLSLTTILNQKNEVEINADDEFYFLNDQHTFGDDEKLDYKKYKETCAEIIVSFKDHLELYFVPAGISRDNALLQLGVKADIGSKLFWVLETPSVLSKEQTYYLISANSEEIKNNDINFHNEEMKLNQGSGQTLTFTNNQKITMDFRIDYLTQQTSIATKNGGATFNCTRDMNEAGLCGPCEYKIEDLTGNLIKKTWDKSDLGLVFKLNGVEFPLEKLDSIVTGDGHLIVIMDFRKMTDDRFINLQVLPWDIKKNIRTVRGFDFSPSCRSKDASLVQDLTPVIHSDLVMEIKGRVLDF